MPCHRKWTISSRTTTSRIGVTKTIRGTGNSVDSREACQRWIQFNNNGREISEPAKVPPVQTVDARTVYDVVLAKAGCWPRDRVTQRTVEEVRNKTGAWGRNAPLEPTGEWFLEGLAPGKTLVDTDDDGMPDKWENAHGLDPNDPADATRIVPAGRSKGHSFYIPFACSRHRNQARLLEFGQVGSESQWCGRACQSLPKSVPFSCPKLPTFSPRTNSHGDSKKAIQRRGADRYQETRLDSALASPKGQATLDGEETPGELPYNWPVIGWIVFMHVAASAAPWVFTGSGRCDVCTALVHGRRRRLSGLSSAVDSLQFSDLSAHTVPVGYPRGFGG